MAGYVTVQIAHEGARAATSEGNADDQSLRSTSLARAGRALRQPVAQSLLRAAGARALALPVSASFSLVTLSIVIRSAGESAFALIAVIMSLMVLLPFADVGVGAAVVNAAAASPDPRTDRHLQRVLLTSFRTVGASAGVGLILDVVLTRLGVWPRLIGAGVANGQVNLAAGGAVALMMLALPFGVGQRLLLGLARTGTSMLLQAVGPPVALLWTVAAVHADAGLPVLAAAVPAGMLVTALLQLVVAVRTSGIGAAKLIAQLPRRRQHPGVSIRATAGPMIVVSIGLPLALQTDRLILAHVAPLDAVASYALALQVYLPVWSVMSAAGLALWPVFARRRASLDEDVRALGVAVVVFTAIGACGGLVLTLAAPPVAALVGHGSVSVPVLLAGSFGLLLLAQSAQLPVGMYLMSPPALRAQAWFVMAMVPVSVAVSIPLAARYGAVGPVLGSVTAILVCQVAPGLTYVHVRRRRSHRAPGPVPT